MAGGPRLRTGDDPAVVSDARPWLLGGGAGRKAAGLAACRARPARPSGAAAMRRPGSSRCDWADAAAVEAAIAAAEAHPRLDPAGRRRRPGAGGGYGAALAAAPARWVGLSLDHRRSMATGRAAGWTRRARSRRCTERGPLAGGGGGGLAGERAAGARLPAGRHLRAGAERARPAARGAGAAGGEAGAGLQPHPRRRHRRRRSRASMARPDPGRVYNVADDEPAPPQDVIAYRGGAPRAAGAAGGALRGGGALADGAELLRRVEAGGEPADQGGARACGSPSPTIAPGCAAILAAGRLRARLQQPRRKSARDSLSALAIGRRIGQKIRQSRDKAPDAAPLR